MPRLFPSLCFDMLKKSLHLWLAALLCFGAAACEKKKTKAQLTAEDEKKWQVQQRQRAAKYYKELVEKFPDSPFAAQAKEKLQQLGPVTPGGKAGGSAATAKK